MNTALTALYALQKVDSALALAQRQYQALDTGAAESSAAETARTLYEARARALQETTRDLQASELELKTVENKKKEFETRLYSGKITVPKEMTATEQEIEALGRQRGRLDERILTLMEQLETRRAEEAEAKKRVEEAEKALAAKQKAYKSAARVLTQHIRALTPQRAERAAPIPPALLKRYEAIRASKQGVGIARIEDSRCGGCHTSLPSNLIRSLEDTDRLETCENCGRLLCLCDE